MQERRAVCLFDLGSESGDALLMLDLAGSLLGAKLADFLLQSRRR